MYGTHPDRDAVGLLFSSVHYTSEINLSTSSYQTGSITTETVFSSKINITHSTYFANRSSYSKSYTGSSYSTGYGTTTYFDSSATASNTASGTFSGAVTTGLINGTLTYHLTASRTSTGLPRVTTTKTNARNSYTTTTTTTAGAGKTTKQATSYDSTLLTTAFSTVTSTRYTTSFGSTSSVLDSVYPGTSTAYTAAVTRTAVFADGDEQLFELATSAGASTGAAGVFYTSSVSSLLVDPYTETFGTTKTALLSSSYASLYTASTATATWQSASSRATITFTYSYHPTTASSRTTTSAVSAAASSTVGERNTATRTGAFHDWFGTTISSTSYHVGTSTYLGLYNDSANGRSRSSVFTRHRFSLFDITSRNAVNTTTNSTFTVLTYSVSLTRSRFQTAANASRRIQVFSSTGIFNGTNFSVAGGGVGAGYVQHPLFRASTDASFAMLSGDTRDFVAPWNVYSSIRPGVKIPVMNFSRSSVSTTVSYDTAAASVYETTGAGSVTDAYEFLASMSQQYLKSTKGYGFDLGLAGSVSNIAGLGRADESAVVQVAPGHAYTRRDSSGGTTTGRNDAFYDTSSLSVAPGDQFIWAPSPIWTRNPHAAGYTTARVGAD